MTIAALDPATLLALMLAGGAFALGGLWLLLRSKPDSGTAKIEVFGLKFESSSAGVLVFLIGSIFIATPIFVPERDAENKRNAEEPTESIGSEKQQDGSATPSRVPSTRPPRVVIEAIEVEPNKSLASANVLEPGTAVRGSVSEDDDDYFIVNIPNGFRGDLVVNAIAEYFSLFIFDEFGAVVWRDPSASTALTYRGAAEGPSRYGIRVAYWNGRQPMRYDLTVTLRPEQ